jgi:3-dehydroquinate synthase
MPRMSIQGRTISVKLAGGVYEIAVEPGLLAKVGQRVRGLSQSGKAAVVTDSDVEPLHLGALKQSLQAAGFESIVAVMPAGEANKSLTSVGPIYDRLLSSGIERNTPLLCLGGGVVTDVGGFVAATVLRGVPLVQIPTTLLAMVDASIGGKTGVDHAVGKNLIGAFYQPVAVFMDPQTLTTLPARQLRSGLAECIKHCLIRDAGEFEQMESQIALVKQLDLAALTDLIAKNVAIKARVVETDPFEKGERAHLNFGHTFGHAIEAVSQFSYSHGEAIALGMCAAAYTSRELGLIGEQDRQRIVGLIAKADLPTGKLKLSADKVVETMQFDKKVKSGRIRFVLLEGIGKATVRDDVPADLVRRAIDSLREG